MFSDCVSLTSIDVSSFDTSKVTDIGSLFSNCESIISLDIKNFDTSSVIYFNSIFQGCFSLESIIYHTSRTITGSWAFKLS